MAEADSCSQNLLLDGKWELRMGCRHFRCFPYYGNFNEFMHKNKFLLNVSGKEIECTFCGHWQQSNVMHPTRTCDRPAPPHITAIITVLFVHVQQRFEWRELLPVHPVLGVTVPLMTTTSSRCLPSPVIAKPLTPAIVLLSLIRESQGNFH